MKIRYNAQNSRVNTKAFTLAELLMAVLVISIIMVALAPVITKRAYDNLAVELRGTKGLQIFTNPGVYAFDVPAGISTLYIQGAGGGGGGAGATYIDKEAVFTSSTTWSIPKGVNQLTFKITGAGGGGGAGNGKTMSDTCESRTNKIPAMADNGQDLCVSRMSPTIEHIATYRIVKYGESCSGPCCWKDLPASLNWTKCNKNIRNPGAGCLDVVCTGVDMQYWCNTAKQPFKFVSGGSDNKGRLISAEEYNRIVAQKPSYLGQSGLDLAWRSGTNQKQPPTTLPDTGISYGCLGAGNNFCYPNIIFGLDKMYAFNQDSFKYTMQKASETNYNYAGSVLCVRDLDTRRIYAGAGGASGAMLEKTISVLPKDTLEITIGKGGEGGTSNGVKGKQGETTKIVHKRNGTELGTFYVKGGLGGNSAATTTNGAAYINGTSSDQTTPNGTCYAKYRSSQSTSYQGGNTQCNIISYSGAAGAGPTGGSGGKYNNSGTAAAGGSLNDGQGNVLGAGFNADTVGFGGGGAACGRGKGITSSKGGKGANGKVVISYRIILPGAGGGSGTRVGGSNIPAGSSSQKDYEIIYKVKQGSRIVVNVGSGGSGGAAGQNGLNGTASIIGNNEIVFLAGSGASAVNQTQKDNLSGCIGNSINSLTVADCLNYSAYKPKVGTSGIINYNNEINTAASGLSIKNFSNVKYTLSASTFKGQNGRSSIQFNASTAPWSYGFDGGSGGAPFGIKANNAAAAITCGGGISAQYGSTNDINNYICTSGSINGNNARSHDPVNNEYGGSGGGGGGAVANSLELGKGGGGSSGYLRIRWDETKNIDW